MRIQISRWRFAKPLHVHSESYVHALTFNADGMLKEKMTLRSLTLAVFDYLIINFFTAVFTCIHFARYTF